MHLHPSSGYFLPTRDPVTSSLPSGRAQVSSFSGPLALPKPTPPTKARAAHVVGARVATGLEAVCLLCFTARGTRIWALPLCQGPSPLSVAEAAAHAEFVTTLAPLLCDAPSSTAGPTRTRPWQAASLMSTVGEPGLFSTRATAVAGQRSGGERS